MLNSHSLISQKCEKKTMLMNLNSNVLRHHHAIHHITFCRLKVMNQCFFWTCVRYTVFNSGNVNCTRNWIDVINPVSRANATKQNLCISASFSVLSLLTHISVRTGNLHWSTCGMGIITSDHPMQQINTEFCISTSFSVLPLLTHVSFNADCCAGCIGIIPGNREENNLIASQVSQFCVTHVSFNADCIRKQQHEEIHRWR